MGQFSRRSAELAAPKGRVIGCEIPILRAEIPLELDRIARRQRHHRLQPEGCGFRDMRPADLAVGAPDFGRASGKGGGKEEAKA